jgi:hypothetical protein
MYKFPNVLVYFPKQGNVLTIEKTLTYCSLSILCKLQICNVLQYRTQKPHLQNWLKISHTFFPHIKTIYYLTLIYGLAPNEKENYLKNFTNGGPRNSIKKPGNIYRKGRLCTIDLLIKLACLVKSKRS